jgi:hypothetical protein
LDEKTSKEKYSMSTIIIGAGFIGSKDAPRHA